MPDTMTETRPEVVVAIDMLSASQRRLESVYPVHVAKTHEARVALAAERGGRIGAIVTNSAPILGRELMEAMPNLRIICTQGVGHEGIDLHAARERGIAVTNGAGTNAPSVADHAMALMLGVMRDVRGADALVRGGGWRKGETMRPMATGKRVGILGLGDIGGRIARRCSGFDMQVAYHNRRKILGLAYRYAASPVALAEMSDVLIVTLPGGPATRHLVGAAELEALGPGGFLVNVGRGSVVDTAALIAALEGGRIAGAGLDVVEGEPAIPEALRRLPNVLFTPHMAGRSPETADAAISLVLSNLDARFAGRPLLTPVPFEGTPMDGRPIGRYQATV